MLRELLCSERGKKWSVLLEICERESVKKSQWRRVTEEEWMCSHMLAGLSCYYQAKRENVFSHVGWSVLLQAREEAERGRELLALPFMLPGEVTRAEWHQSFSLDEIYKFKTPTAKTIPALNNDLKLFLLQVFIKTTFLMGVGTSFDVMVSKLD